MKKSLIPFLFILALHFILTGCRSSNPPKVTVESTTEEPTTFAESTHASYNNFDKDLKRITETHDVDWILIKAIIIKESHFNGRYISTSGAVGLMQLMPREGSYFSENYKNYAKSRLQKRNSSGERVYKGKKDAEWASAYVRELDSITNRFQDSTRELYATDKRFNPLWNIESGVTQFANDFDYFRKRGHGPYGSRIYALAAYNAGRGAVVKDKANRYTDRIPVNKQTELYVGYIERIYEELLKQDGLVNKENEWVLKI